MLKLDSSVHKGMYFRRYHGKIGVVRGKRGMCYETLIKDNNKEKTLIIHPIHLTKVSFLEIQKKFLLWNHRFVVICKK